MTVILNDVDVKEGVRYFTATIEGVRYEIPEMWSIGYCRTHGGSAIDAARAWHEQAQLEKAFEAGQKNVSLIGKTLRRFSAAGPCLTYSYGVIVKYTDKTVTYRTERGEIKRAGGYDWHSNGTREIGKGLLHCEPCCSCMDHARTQYPNGYQD